MKGGGGGGGGVEGRKKVGKGGRGRKMRMGLLKREILTNLS